MKQTTRQFSGILLALLILVIAVFMFFYLVQPEYGNLMTLKGTVANDQQFLATQQKIAAQVQGAITAEESQSSSSQAIAFALPVGPDTAGALAQIYGLAAANGMTVESVGVSLQSATQSAPQSTSASASGTASLASLIKPAGSITFQVSATGSYEALKAFLGGLETNVRIFDVTALSVKPVPTVTTAGASVNGTQDLYNYNLTVVAYYQSS